MLGTQSSVWVSYISSFQVFEASAVCRVCISRKLDQDGVAGTGASTPMWNVTSQIGDLTTVPQYLPLQQCENTYTDRPLLPSQEPSSHCTELKYFESCQCCVLIPCWSAASSHGCSSSDPAPY